MKNKLILIIVLVALAVLGYVVINQNSKPVIEVPENPTYTDHTGYLEEAIKNAPSGPLFSPLSEPITIKAGTNKELCFADYSVSTWDDASYHLDGGTMRLQIQGNKVTGESVFSIAGKDGWFTKFEGTIDRFVSMPVTINGWEQSQSEGITNEKEMVKLVFNGKEIEVIREADTDNPSDTSTPAVYCHELYEWEGVGSYLQRQMSLYLDYIAIDYENNTGYFLTSFFPDKNGKFTQQKRNFSYTTNDKNVILYVKILGQEPLIGENLGGEADPSVMRLDMTTWYWISALYNDGKEIKPKTSGEFTLNFGSDGKFSSHTDCNTMSGNYEVNGKQIVFSQMMSTLMLCEGSQESDFRRILENTSSYFFTSRGELILEQKLDSGTATFR